MKTYNIVESFDFLGKTLYKIGNNESIESFHPLIQEEFYDKLQHAIKSAEIYNKWFTEESVRHSFKSFGEVLTKENIEDWLSNYKKVREPKSVGLILAGNIPLVGFHDIISTILSGNKAIIKLSRDDDKLIPLLLEILSAFNPEVKKQYELADRLNDIEALIATGSDNTARYFEKYFGHLPRIIRKNRTSIAVLTGNESKEELKLLGKDLFTYFGMGCRNVSHLLLPKDYDLDNIFGAIVDYGEVINHNKYCNNYDYYKAIFLMNLEPIIENGFLITRESEELFTPIAVLHYHFYESEEDVKQYLEEHKEKIQVIVGQKYLPFGSTQTPALNEYADGVDTMEFLSNL